MVLENILLLSCRSSFVDSDKVYPPLANLYLQGVLKKHRPNVGVTVTDDYNLNPDAVDPLWLRGFDGVGISVMTPQREESRKLLSYIKDKRPDMKVFIGGPHAKHYLADVRPDPWDYIVIDDGFRAILDIVDGKSSREINDHVNVHDYPSTICKPARLENKDYLKGFNYKLQGRDSTTMLTAQGCPEQCTFCEDAMTGVRWTPLDMVKEELDDIKTLGYQGVYIFDDLFALAQKKVKPITDELSKRGLVYRCNGQARLFSRDFAQMLGNSGCVEIAFGAETGSQKILDNIRKRTTIEQNYNFVKWARDAGIKVKAFLMIGLPGETLETIADTEKFIQNAGIEDFQLAVYYPYKGTQIRDAIDAGRNEMDISFEGEGLGAYGQKGGSSEAVVRTGALSSSELLEHRDRIVHAYRPKSHSQKWQDDKFFDTHFATGETGQKEKDGVRPSLVQIKKLPMYKPNFKGEEYG